jgi:aminoglycoside 3-N-acetyltransferase
MNIIDADKIISAFKECGVSSGDTVFLHCDAFFLAQISGTSTLGKMDFFFNILDQLLSESGTLVLPTFTYSFTKGEEFNLEETPSTVGLLTEYFRNREGVKRSKDPNFSIACSGRYMEQFINAPYYDTFGPDSIFGLLHRQNAHIICLGCSLDRITFTHYVEEQLKVDYRYFKEFSGNVIEQSRTNLEKVNYFVRDTSFGTVINLTLLKKTLEEKKILKKSTMGRSSLLSVSAIDFFEQAKDLLRSNKYGLIEAGQLIL